jgi:ParB/RepB/Spo0J family partition protein
MKLSKRAIFNLNRKHIMKNSTINSATAAASSTTQTLDLNLSSDGIEPDPRVSNDRVINASSPQVDISVTGNLVGLFKTDCIRISSMPNRAQESYQSTTFDELCASINSAGRNTQPISIRVLTDAEKEVNPAHQYELISGERRLRACAECGLRVRAIVVTVAQSKNFSLDALIENLHRENLSPFEFGRQILHVLATDSGLSLRRLALKLGCDVSIVSRAKDIASLPPEVIAAFTSCADIRYADAKPLSDAVAAAGEAAISEALRIAKNRQALKPAEIVNLITAAAKRVTAQGPRTADGSRGAPLERLASSRSLSCSDKEVGSLKLDKQGRVQVNLFMTLTSEQQVALVQQIEGFIQRRVLRNLLEKTKAVKQKVTDSFESAVVIPEDRQKTEQKRRSVA